MEKLQSLHEYESSPIFTPLERLALRYADALTETPVTVPDALFDELRARFSPAQLVELTAAITWENYRARFNHAFGAESEGFSKAAYCAIPSRPPHAAHTSSGAS